MSCAERPSTPQTTRYPTSPPITGSTNTMESLPIHPAIWSIFRTLLSNTDHDTNDRVYEMICAWLNRMDSSPVLSSEERHRLWTWIIERCLADNRPWFGRAITCLISGADPDDRIQMWNRLCTIRDRHFDDDRPVFAAIAGMIPPTCIPEIIPFLLPYLRHRRRIVRKKALESIEWWVERWVHFNPELLQWVIDTLFGLMHGPDRDQEVSIRLQAAAMIIRYLPDSTRTNPDVLSAMCTDLRSVLTHPGSDAESFHQALAFVTHAPRWWWDAWGKTELSLLLQEMMQPHHRMASRIMRAVMIIDAIQDRVSNDDDPLTPITHVQMLWSVMTDPDVHPDIKRALTDHLLRLVRIWSRSDVVLNTIRSHIRTIPKNLTAISPDVCVRLAPMIWMCGGSVAFSIAADLLAASHPDVAVAILGAGWNHGQDESIVQMLESIQHRLITNSDTDTIHAILPGVNTNVGDRVCHIIRTVLPHRADHKIVIGLTEPETILDSPIPPAMVAITTDILASHPGTATLSVLRRVWTTDARWAWDVIQPLVTPPDRIAYDWNARTAFLSLKYGLRQKEADAVPAVLDRLVNRWRMAIDGTTRDCSESSLAFHGPDIITAVTDVITSGRGTEYESSLLAILSVIATTDTVYTDPRYTTARSSILAVLRGRWTRSSDRIRRDLLLTIIDRTIACFDDGRQRDCSIPDNIVVEVVETLADVVSETHDPILAQRLLIIAGEPSYRSAVCDGLVRWSHRALSGE